MFGLKKIENYFFKITKKSKIVFEKLLQNRKLFFG